jgi:serine/threonine protein kinase
MAAVPAGLANALQDRYRLDRELGRGGMATVYLAHDLRHDRDVALKVLRPELAAVLGRERFLAEIRLTAKLDHPHILTLIDSGESDGFLWYVLPFIRGESLRQKLDREKQLGIAEALEIAGDIAGALDYAHAHGVIHRDVKPENILLHEGQAMLADFGIALAVREAAGERLTETGLSVGTPQYMSPEQATAERQLDARTDVYSLGAVLYEMLAGEPPFTGATGQAVIAKLMTERPTALRVVRDTVPEGIENAVARALAKVSADRFRSAGEFAEALRAPAPRLAWPGLKLRTVLIVAASFVVLAAGVSLVPALRSRARVEPSLTQVTFSGNAELPALSPDGRQLAYAVKHCGPLRDCSYSVVIQDLGSAERRSLADGYGNVYNLIWSRDQRFLILTGTRTGTSSDFLLSILGAREQVLGCCRSEFLATSDTVIQSPPKNQLPSDTGIVGRWFYLLTADGRKVDSIPSHLAGGNAIWPLPAPDGRRLLIWSYSGEDYQRYYLATRAGMITDSIPFLRGSHGLRMQWTAAGDGVLMLVRSDSSEGALWTLLRVRVSADGRARLPPDTLAAPLRLPGVDRLTPPSQTGDLALQLGGPSFELWTLERRSLAAPPVLERKLFSATGAVTPALSPDGKRVAALRPVTLGGNPATQLEVWPFEGGSGVAIGPPATGVLDLDWSSDGHEVYRLTRRTSGNGPLDLSAVDMTSGRIRDVRTVQDGLRGLLLLRDGVLVYESRGGAGLPAEWRSLPQGDSAPRLFAFDDSTTWIESLAFLPVGRGSYIGALSAAVDSTWKKTGTIRHAVYLAPSGERARRVAEFDGGPGNNVSILHIGSEPSIEMAFKLGTTMRWLHVEPGRPPRDLGPLPVHNFPSLFSDDGRRGVVVEEETHSDAWLLRWPKP